MHASDRRLRKFTFYDLNTFEYNPLHLAQWLEEKASAAALGLSMSSPQSSDFSSAFPLLVLSYADQIDLPESISHVLSLRGDAVCVFTPHFCMGNVTPCTYSHYIQNMHYLSFSLLHSPKLTHPPTTHYSLTHTVFRSCRQGDRSQHRHLVFECDLTSRRLRRTQQQ